MDKIRVGIVGYGTIGKRVADAVALQDDMELVGITAHSYNYRMISAQLKKTPMYRFPGAEDLNGLKITGDFDELLDNSDVIVDCTPKKDGAANKEKYYAPKGLKAIFQGGEKPKVADASFTAQVNYDKCVGKQFIRVVSCNTTGLTRTLNAVNERYGIDAVHATMIRRGADPWDIKHGPINAIVPVLELPSHHGPDVQTVMEGLPIFTTALSIPTTLMHLHSVTVDCKETPDVKEILDLFNNTTRVRVMDNASGVRSTAEIMEFAKDLGRERADMPEIVIWKEALGVTGNKLLYLQAIHQESDVVCENIDAVRAAMGFEDGAESIRKTNKSLDIDYCKKIC